MRDGDISIGNCFSIIIVDSALSASVTYGLLIPLQPSPQVTRLSLVSDGTLQYSLYVAQMNRIASSQLLQHAKVSALANLAKGSSFGSGLTYSRWYLLCILYNWPDGVAEYLREVISTIRIGIDDQTGARLAHQSLYTLCTENSVKR